MSSIIVIDSDEEENEVPAKKARLEKIYTTTKKSQDAAETGTKAHPKISQPVNRAEAATNSNGSVVVPKISSVQSMKSVNNFNEQLPLQLLATPPHTSSDANSFNEQLMMSPPNILHPTSFLHAPPSHRKSSAEKPVRRIQPTTLLKNSDETWIQNRQKHQQLKQRAQRSLSILPDGEPSKNDSDDDVVEVLPARSSETHRIVTSASNADTVTSLDSQNQFKNIPLGNANITKISAGVNGSAFKSDGTNNNNISSETPLKNSDADRAPLVSEYEDLIELCRKADASKDMEKLIQSKLLKYYYSVHSDFVKSRGFRKTVSSTIERIRSEPKMIYINLKVVLDELNVRRKSKVVVIKTEETPSSSSPSMAAESTKAAAAETSTASTGNKRTDEQIRKLNKALYILTKRIDKLEAAEVDLDDDDSSYLQVERYKKRACQIYGKICDLTGESKNAYRLIKKPVRFNGTNYPKFNKVLQAYINKTKEFPDFSEVLRVLEHCNDQYNLKLLNFEMKRVAQDAFIKIGKLLQSRRKTELYETVTHFTANSRDPALTDPVLQSKLNDNQKLHKRIAEIIDKYARNQDSPTEEMAVEAGGNEGASSSTLAGGGKAQADQEIGEEDDDEDDDEDEDEGDIEADVETLANGAPTLELSDAELDAELKDIEKNEEEGPSSLLESDETKTKLLHEAHKEEQKTLGNRCCVNNASVKKTDNKIDPTRTSNGKSPQSVTEGKSTIKLVSVRKLLEMSHVEESETSCAVESISETNPTVADIPKGKNAVNVKKTKSTNDAFLSTAKSVETEFSVAEIIISDEEEE